MLAEKDVFFTKLSGVKTTVCFGDLVRKPEKRGEKARRAEDKRKSSTLRGKHVQRDHAEVVVEFLCTAGKTPDVFEQVAEDRVRRLRMVFVDK